MSVAWAVTPHCEERLFADRFAGKRASMRLCVNPGSLTTSSTRTQWEAVELSGNGYARYEWTIPAGSYNATAGRWEAPPQLCEFSASSGGNGLTWNTAVIVLGTYVSNVFAPESGVSFILSEGSNQTILAGATPRSYQVIICTDGLSVTS